MSTEQDNRNFRLFNKLAASAEHRTLRLGMDYVNKSLWYGIEIDGSLHFLKTGLEALQVNELPHGISATGRITGSPISTEGIKRYMQGADVDGAKLIRELTEYFATHAKFQHDTIPAVLAHWVVAGYAYMAFPCFPYLSLTSAQPACGKSRVLELLAEVAFRAKPIITNPTSAVLYRSLHDTAQALLIDEFEDATDDGKKAMISVLNAGFVRGATVPRCSGDNFDIKHFHAYSPKAFAGLARVPEALKTRSIPILMMPKTPEDQIKPFHPSEYQSTAEHWRDNAAIWALCNAPKLEIAAIERGKLEIPAYLQDREIDYMTPLFATARMAGSDVGALRNFCRVLAQTRKARAAEGEATRAVQALITWFPEDKGEARLFVSEAANLFCGVDALIEPTEKDAADLLRKMGLDVRQIRIGPDSRKGAEITRQQLEDLAQRFTPPVDRVPEDEAAEVRRAA